MSVADHRWLVRSIVIAQFGPAFMFSGVAIALPAMGSGLGMSATSLGLVETTFIGSSMAFLLPAGRYVDGASRGAVFRWALLAFGLLSLLIGCVTAGWMVLVLRVLQGLAAALCTAAGPALLMELVPAERRGRVFGAMMGMAYAGLALGPLAAGWIVEYLGWRSVFFIGAAQILVGGLPALMQVNDRWRRSTAQMPWPSVVLVAATVASIIVAISAPERQQSPWPVAVVAAALGCAFVVVQLRARSPLLDLRELRRSIVLRAALVAQALLYLNAYCSIFLLSLFLQVGKGLDTRVAGVWLACGSLVMAAIAPSAGRLADRVRPQRVAGLGVVGVLGSSLLGLQLDVDSGAWCVGLVLALQGLGFGLFSSPNLTLILTSLPGERSGFASAIAAQSRGVGMFSGMAVTSALVAFEYGGAPIASQPESVFGVVRSAYGILVGTSLLALLTSALAGLQARRAGAGLV